VVLDDTEEDDDKLVAAIIGKKPHRSDGPGKM
jgi:hypothetical protein